MIDVKDCLVPTSGVATDKLSAVGAGHARDEAAKKLCKCRQNVAGAARSYGANVLNEKEYDSL